MKIVESRTIVVGTPWREVAFFELDTGEACAAHPRTGGRIRLFEQGWKRRGFGGS